DTSTLPDTLNLWRSSNNKHGHAEAWPCHHLYDRGELTWRDRVELAEVVIETIHAAVEQDAEEQIDRAIHLAALSTNRVEAVRVANRLRFLQTVRPGPQVREAVRAVPVGRGGQQHGVAMVVRSLEGDDHAGNAGFACFLDAVVVCVVVHEPGE